MSINRTMGGRFMSHCGPEGCGGHARLRRGGMRAFKDNTGQGHPHQPPAHHQKYGGMTGQKVEMYSYLGNPSYPGSPKLGHDSGLQLRAVHVDPPRTGDDKARAGIDIRRIDSIRSARSRHRVSRTSGGSRR